MTHLPNTMRRLLILTCAVFSLFFCEPRMQAGKISATKHLSHADPKRVIATLRTPLI